MKTNLKRKLKIILPSWLIRLGFMSLGFLSVFKLPGFFSDYFKFKKQMNKSGRDMSVKFNDLLPIFGENTAKTGFDHHYIYHPAWAARIVKQINPVFHTDISSTLSFCSMLSAFIPVKFYDYRPAELELSNLTSGHADLTALPFADNEITSLSCMHTVEHVGLGRYGDNLDAEGDLKAMRELNRVVAHGGNLLFVVPIGSPKIMFNGHRIYSYDQIINYFSGLHLKEFSLITDSGFGKDFIINATKQQADKQIYGCGCFWFVKP